MVTGSAVAIVNIAANGDLNVHKACIGRLCVEVRKPKKTHKRKIRFASHPLIGLTTTGEPGEYRARVGAPTRARLSLDEQKGRGLGDYSAGSDDGVAPLHDGERRSGGEELLHEGLLVLGQLRPSEHCTEQNALS